MTWQLSDWLETCKKGIRHRRRPLSRRAPTASAERLEGRALLTGNTIVSGLTFIDANSNAQKDAGEVAVRGIAMTLSNAGDTFNETVTTDANGKFLFFRVPAGAYKLTAEPGAQLTGSAVPVDVEVLGDSGTVNQPPIALGGLKPTFLSLRQFLNTSTTETLPLEAAGNGRKGNEIPTVLGAVNLDVSFTTTASPAMPAAKTVDLAGIFTDQDFKNSEVKFRTSAGDINVELFDKEAPITVANFYEYATSDDADPARYNDSIFHRLASGFVLQGGGFKLDNPPNDFPEVSEDPTIQNEFNGTTRSNFANTIAMAKLPGDPDSASSQFFFNLGNNSANLNGQNGGFTVFGKLAGSTPTASGTVTDPVLLDLADTPVSNRSSTNGAFDALPLENYTDPPLPADPIFPTDATSENFLRILGIDTVRRKNEVLSYSLMSGGSPVEEIDTSLFTAEIINHRLTITPKADQSGQAEIVVRATDLAGESVTTTFRVHVAPVGNVAPTAIVALNPSQPRVNSTLTATATVADSNSSDQVKLTYVWKVGSTVVRTTSATSSTTDMLDLGSSDIGNEAVGNIITVEVTPNDGFVDGTKVTATRTLVSSNSAPTATVALAPSSPTVNSVLTATATAADVNGQSVKLTYVWKVGTTTVQTSSSPTESLTDTLDLSKIATEVAGNTITVEVTPNDGTVDGTKVTATQTLANSAPTATVALSPESPLVNSVLTATATAADVNGQPVKLIYVWKVGSTVVKTTAATSSLTNTLDLSTISEDMVGEVVTVEVTPNDGLINGALVSALRTIV